MSTGFAVQFSQWCRYSESSVREQISPWGRACARWENRIKANPYRLSFDEYLLLRQTKFPFAAIDLRWMDHFADLGRFRQQQGHCRVPRSEPLGFWVTQQRRYGRLGKLSPWKRRALNRIGFCWDSKTELWEERLGELRTFLHQHGHTRVPEKGQYRKLALWIENLRYSDRTLSPAQRQKLQQLGFVWKVHVAQWEVALAELKDFVEEKGHADVPQNCTQYPKAAAMLTHQRQCHREGTLDPAKAKQLEALGVCWNIRDDIWNKHYAELVRIHRRLGHVRLPKGWPENKKLERWLRNQRERWEQLSSERQAKLASLGVRLEWPGKRDGFTLKELILKQLQRAGSEGLKLENLAAKVKAKRNIVAVWFHGMGKSLPEVEKIKHGWYRYRPTLNSDTGSESALTISPEKE